MSNPPLNKPDIDRFHTDGYLRMPSLFDEQETDLLRREIEVGQAYLKPALSMDDGKGGTSQLAIWREERNDVLAMVTRNERVVDAMEQLLGGEVYHWHSKVMLKKAREGGAWVWHQDYGYWYNDGCLFPDLASCMIAIDRANRENGCLQVLRGSHRMGRIEHGRVGGQVGADVERIEEVEKTLDRVYCEMEPGDALFFHCNTLHRSDQNKSDNPRRALICCYNMARNSSYKKGAGPAYTPLERVSSNAIKEFAVKSAPKD